MEFELLGDTTAGPTLRLDHKQFAYAGKFVMSSTGKTVVHENGEILGATAFSADHSDDATVRIRYVTVREDRRGEGIGPKLLRFTADSLQDSYARVAIAVNNPIAYEACYRAGFVFTGDETGIAELRLRYQPTHCDSRPYRDGFALFRNRELPAEHDAVLSAYADSDPPRTVDIPRL